MAPRMFKKHKVYNVSYHITWIPKYRKKLIVGKIEAKLREFLIEKALSIDIIIDTYEIMPDHVHLFIKSKPDITISYIVKQLKGYTSYRLRKHFPSLRRVRSLWTKSYFAETIGLISESTVKKYIEMQHFHS